MYHPGARRARGDTMKVMIVLVTGKPGSGKSTALSTLTERYDDVATWVVTHAILDAAGKRLGFAAENNAGQRWLISHKTDIESATVVGSNRVDRDALDAAFAKVLHDANAETVTLIDEIGPMQLLSDEFRRQLRRAFEAKTVQLVASVHYNDSQSAPYRMADHALLLEVTEANRDALPGLLHQLLQRRQQVDDLPPAQFAAFKGLLERAIKNNAMLQAEKLCCNALEYVWRVKLGAAGGWIVAGSHGTYNITDDQGLRCTCDLFNGRGKYARQAGECSHIQAVHIRKGDIL